MDVNEIMLKSSLEIARSTAFLNEWKEPGSYMVDNLTDPEIHNHNQPSCVMNGFNFLLLN